MHMTRKSFRILVATYVAYVPLYLILSYLDYTRLSPAGQATWDNVDIGATLAGLVVGLPAMVAWFAGVAGLVRLKRWGLWAFAAGNFLGLLALLLQPEVANTGLKMTSDGVYWLWAGVILCTGYWTDLLE